MKIYYHNAFYTNLESILERGLLPKKDIAFNVISSSLNSFGITANPGYVYLFGKDPEKGSLCVGLKATLPGAHIVTIDYDQMTIFLAMDEARLAGETRRGSVERCFKKFDIDFTGELTEENIVAQMDRIPENLWREIADCYRTSKPIPPECLEVVRLPDKLDQEALYELKELAEKHNLKYKTK